MESEGAAKVDGGEKVSHQGESTTTITTTTTTTTATTEESERLKEEEDLNKKMDLEVIEKLQREGEKICPTFSIISNC